MLQCTVNATSEAWKRMDIWMVETGARHQADGMVLARRFLLGDGDLAQVSPVAEELGGVAAKQPKRLAVVEVRERSIARDVDLDDVDLAHLQHPPHHLGCSLTVGIPQQIRQHCRHHLPPDAVLVLEPAALARLSLSRECVPVVVDLFLIRARDRERHRLGEGKLRSAVEDLERLPIDLKFDEYDRGVDIWADIAEPIDIQDPGVLEDRDVTLYRMCHW